MSSISVGTTTTTGYVVTSDSTGALVLKTGASATTAVTIDTSQNVTFVGSQTLSGGTANGVLYLNGSKAATSGSALTFDGTDFGVSGGNARINKNSNATILTLGGSPSANWEGDIQFVTSNTETNWRVASNRVTAGSFTITPSTAGGGSTFTTPAINLSSSGNLGLGVAPSAWGGVSTGRVFQTGGASFYGRTDNSDAHVGTNFYRDSSNTYRYINTAPAAFLQLSQNSFNWNIAPSGTAGNAITFTQAMTLDASGELGIGNTSPATKLDVVGGNLYDGNFYLTAQFRNQVAASEKGILLGYNNADTSSIIASAYASGSGALAFWTHNNSTWGERARIDSSGNLLVGTTSLSGYTIAKFGVYQTVSGYWPIATRGVDRGIVVDMTTNSGIAVYFLTNTATTVAGQISVSGSTTSYQTSSDYRLKENIAPMTGALARVAALKPVTYTWKADGTSAEGFLAHELAEACPQAVFGKKDDVNEDGSIKPQGIDTSFLVATLTAAIKEQQVIIQQLQADVAALKGTA
jgi:hypothetical protein